MTAMNTVQLVPFALKNAPALIEILFPAQKVSFEAQTERKAVAAQTLTGLGSYWKGRKPLILVRAIVLGSLLPPTDNAEADLAMFEKLMAFDDEGLARRALAANAFSASVLQNIIPITDPERYFGTRGWRRDISDDDKLVLYRQALATLANYEEKASVGKRPEEVDQDWLYAPVWPLINRHYAHLGINVKNLPELVEQLGILRYGHRPRVGDTFSGGGSIPFEAARIGCDAYASDLNPIACMLTWGAFNIVGASAESRAAIEKENRIAANSVASAIDALGIERDAKGNQAKAFIYCMETRCPESGWLVPLSPTWVISKNGNVIALLVPDYANKRFDIQIKSGATTEEMRAATTGTVVDGNLLYQLDSKTFRTPIKTLRGDFRDLDRNTGNRLRQWVKEDFVARSDDTFKERLYAIHWRSKDTLKDPRPKTYFAAPSEADLIREQLVEKIVAENLSRWQDEGLVPDMAIEPGYNTDQPIRERGWTYWHHLFNPRQLLLYAELKKHASATLSLSFCQMINTSARLTRWTIGDGPGRSGGTKQVFDNQALNVLYNYGCRASCYLLDSLEAKVSGSTIPNGPRFEQRCVPAAEISSTCDLFITDPPYADAVNYHEITEFFIAWLRKNPPKPLDELVWDSRRALAVKGSGDNFRRGMIDAYTAMANHMPENGMQCVMFTHQSTEVWSDMVGIFWAAGLQVVAAWYIATETTSDLKKGGYVQGTVTLMLRKRPIGEKVGFKQRILPVVRQEVAAQIKQMMHLNDETVAHMGEPVFNDADLQMAGYAAALKVLTAYTKIGEVDVTTFAFRPRVKGEETVVDEIVQQASEAANSLLVPEGMSLETWQAIGGIQRFYLRMLDMESVGASKLDNYQNFAKAFAVDHYSKVMASMTANGARLKQVNEFSSRELTDSTEIGPTWLGHLMIAIQQLLTHVEPQSVVKTLMEDLPDYLEVRPKLIDLVRFLENKSRNEDVRSAAEVLVSRMQTQRLDS